MKDMCPCCGQVTKTVVRAVTVDLDLNMLHHRGRQMRLSGRLAEMAHILARRMPGTASLDTIASEMWGEMGQERARCNISVAVMQLRRVLPSGLRIINEYGTGYRMVEVSRTERAFSPETGAEHAQA